MDLSIAVFIAFQVFVAFVLDYSKFLNRYKKTV
jgi:hypothetical protein